MSSRSASRIPALFQGINYDENRTNDVQVLKRLQDKGLKQCIVVTCANSKSGVVLHDPPKRSLERRIAVREIPGKSREEVISLAFGLLLARKINDDVRRRISSKRRAISCAIDDFPVPACPKRTRKRSEAGSFTQLTMKSKKVRRVPVRQPFSGVNREPVPYGISLIFASSSATILRLIISKLSGLRTSV